MKSKPRVSRAVSQQKKKIKELQAQAAELSRMIYRDETHAFCYKWALEQMQDDPVLRDIATTAVNLIIQGIRDAVASRLAAVKGYVPPMLRG